MSTQSNKILVLLNNSLVNDGRVVRQIRSLAQRNFDITVLCRSDDETSSVFTFEGAQVVRRAAMFKPSVFNKKSPSHDLKQPATNKPIIPEKLYQKAKKVFSPLHAQGRNILRKVYYFLRAQVGFLIHISNFKMLVKNTKEIDFSQFSLIHTHDLHTLPSAYYLSRKYHIPYIYDAHEFETNNIGVTFLSRLGIYPIERYYSRKASRVVTVCNEIGNMLETNYHIEKPIIVYNTPVLVTSNSGVTIKKRLGLDSHTPLAVYIGHFTVARARNEIMQAFIDISAAHLAIVGSNPSYNDAIIRYAKELGIEDRIHLIEHQAPEALIHFISDADLSFLIFHDDIMNHVYAMPNKLFESAFAKLPIIYFTKLISIRHFMEEFNIGFPVGSYQPHEITEAIRQVILNKKDYVITDEKFSQILNSYAWEKQVDKLEKLYSQIIAKEAVSCVE